MVKWSWRGAIAKNSGHHGDNHLATSSCKWVRRTGRQ
jgi:hypothetical protein